MVSCINHKTGLLLVILASLHSLVSSTGTQSFQYVPDSSIDYLTQTPWEGVHEVSISNEEVDLVIEADSHVKYRDAVVSLVLRRLMSNEDKTSLRRHLGDFDALNNILKGTVISIPDINGLNAGTVMFSDVLVWARNMKCFDISVSDIIINHGRRGSKEYDLSIDIIDLAIDCDLGWRYEYSLFAGEGTAQVYTSRSDASVTLKFKSINFDSHPPSSVEADQCTTAIEIDDMEFQGGIVAAIVNLFQGALQGSIEGAIKGAACDELSSLGNDLLSDVLDLVYNMLEGYLSDNLTPEQTDYLLPEKEISLPTDNFLDLSSFGESSGDWLQTLLKTADDFLSGTTIDPNSPTGTGVDLEINRLLRSFVLDSERALKLDLSMLIFDSHDMLTESKIELTQVKLFGLDTFESFDSLESLGKFTLSNHFAWNHLDAELDFTVTIKPSSLDNSLIDVGSIDEVVENFKVSVGFNNPEVNLYFLLALDEAKIGGLQLGSIITNISNIVPCALGTIHDVEITGFAVEVSSIDSPTLDGFLSQGIDRVFSDAADAIFSMYEATLLDAIPNIFEITMKQILNDLLSTFLLGIDTSCPTFEAISDLSDFLNLGDLLLSPLDAIKVGGKGFRQYGNLFSDVISIVKDQVLGINPRDGMSYANEVFITKLTGQQSSIPGALTFPTELGAAVRLEIGELRADVEAKISDVVLSNIDSVGMPLDFAQPISRQVLNNTFTLGAGPEPLQASALATIIFNDGLDIQLENKLKVGFEIHNMTVNAAGQISILENAFMKFPFEDILNFNCWLATIPAPSLDSSGVRTPDSELTLGLKELGMAMSSGKLDISCVSCTSPLLEVLSEKMSSPEAVKELTELMNSVLDYITNLLGGNFLQVQLDRMLADAPKQCPHNEAFIAGDMVKVAYENFEYQKQPSDSIDFMFIIAAVIASLFLISALVYVAVRFVNRKRHTQWIRSLTDEEMVWYAYKQHKDIEKINLMNASTTSMIASKDIPWVLRFAMPFLILANIGFFLSGHLSLGASVDVDINIAGEAVRIKEVFVFSMAESITDMWDAGAKELAILILIFSGLWPYTKQLAVLVLWFTPPKFVSVKIRESIFLWLDTLGKWSFVDIFVLILSLASFRVSVNTPNDASFIPEDLINFNLLVIPCWGLYSNMIAQFISQINSHVIIHYHRKMLSKFEVDDSERDQNLAEVSKPLCGHSYNRTALKRGKLLVLRSITNPILLICSLLFLGLLIFGCIWPSYSLEQFGLVGLASSKPYMAHSVFSTMHLLIEQAKFTGLVTDYIGLSVLSVVLILTVLVVPCLQLAYTLRRWFIPLTEKARRRNFVIIEALQAWQYIEVYLFSIIVASWQLGSVSEFLINDYCGGLEGTFAMLQFYGILGINDAQCFRVSAKLEAATWILMAASIILLVICHFVNSAAAQQEQNLKKIDDVSTSIAFDFALDMDAKDKQGNFIKKNIRPEPAVFTDYYRFLLKRNN